MTKISFPRHWLIIFLITFFLIALSRTFPVKADVYSGCQNDDDCSLGQTCDIPSGRCVSASPPPGAACPNGICESGEGYTSCPLDCPLIPGTVERCGDATSCPGGSLLCVPSCDATPRACWDDCPPGGPPTGYTCQSAQDCFNAGFQINCGSTPGCGEVACGPTGCYSDCRDCSQASPGPSCTALPPGRSSNPVPADGSMTGANVTYQWNLSTWGNDCIPADNPNSTANNQFSVLLGSSQNNLGYLCNYTNLSDAISGSNDIPLCNSTNLTPGQTYYWRVDALNGALSSSSDIWQFYVCGSSASPAKPTLVSPGNNTEIHANTVTLDWNDVTDWGATCCSDGTACNNTSWPSCCPTRQYHIHLDTNEGWSPEIGTSTSSSYNAAILGVNIQHDWKVCADNGSGLAFNCSDVWHFTPTNIPPSPATNGTPQGYFYNNIINFQWQHDGYWGINLADTGGGASGTGGLGLAHYINDDIYNNNESVRWAYTSYDYWKDLEPSEGSYNWSPINTEITKATNAGKKIWLQVQTSEYLTKEEQIPGWAIQAGIDFYQPYCGEGGEYSPDIPGVWDPLYRQKFGNLLQAAAGQYNNAPEVEAVVIMGGGTYGEMSFGVSCNPWDAPGCTPDVLNPNCSAIQSLARVLSKPAAEVASLSDCNKNPSGTAQSEYGNTCYVFDDYFIERLEDLIDRYASAFTNKPLVLQYGSGLSGGTRVPLKVMDWANNKYGNRVWFKWNGWGPQAAYWTSRQFNDRYGSSTKHGYEVGVPIYFSRSWWSNNGGDAAAKTAIHDAVEEGIIQDDSSFLALQTSVGSNIFDTASLQDRGGGKLGNEYYFNPNDHSTDCSASEIENWCPGYLNSVLGGGSGGDTLKKFIVDYSTTPGGYNWASPKCVVGGGLSGTYDSCGPFTVDWGANYYWRVRTSNNGQDYSDSNTYTDSAEWSFLPYHGPWYQVAGGDVYAEGRVATNIPVDTCSGSCQPYFMLDAAGGNNHGTVIYGGGIQPDLGNYCGGNPCMPDHLAPKDLWYATSSYGGKIYDYAYWLDHFKDETINLLGPGNLDLSSINNDGIYKLDAATQNIHGNVASGRKVILLSDHAITVDANATVPVGSFLMVVGSGDLTISSTIGGNSASPGVQGIYIANKINIPSSGGTDVHLWVGGSLIAWDTISLGRDLASIANNTEPAMTFVFRPDFIINAPNTVENFTLQSWRQHP